MKLNKEELKVIVILINNEQFDGCRHKTNRVDLTELKNKIKEMIMAKQKKSVKKGQTYQQMKGMKGK